MAAQLREAQLLIEHYKKDLEAEELGKVRTVQPLEDITRSQCKLLQKRSMRCGC